MIRPIVLAAVAAVTLGVSAPVSARVTIAPLPRPGSVWVEPVYRVEYEQVWVADRVERTPEQYWVSATYGWRTIIAYDECGRRIETREWGQIAPGHWETRYREVVVAGHYETRERRVLVSAGHWAYVGPPPVVVEPPVVIVPSPGPAKVNGYAQEWEKDKGKFSPLYEWPK
jgi:hypothetical protein